VSKTNRGNRPLHVYGPVPSRRLGFSLGVDILPFKTCSLDCVYCQLGSTKRKTIRRQKYFSEQSILRQIKKAVDSGQRIDAITFSGSGEPTLNLSIGKLIREIKKIISIPVAVLTNSTLLTRKSVREALSPADLIIPSLDAAAQDVFERVNRPHPSLEIRRIIEGLKIFSRDFKGKIWLEVLLVKGINDSPSHLQKLKEAIAEINPDRIQLNTVVRPPADASSLPLDSHELEKIKRFMGEKTEVIAAFGKIQHLPSSLDIQEAILSLVKRRPVTLSDMSLSLGKHKNELIKYIDDLIRRDKLKYVIYQGKKYYEPGQEKKPKKQERPIVSRNRKARINPENR
jgi:wyosine [tRNA(Phe)-imidazoG37] synthetase (radical SAM superfamily)